MFKLATQSFLKHVRNFKIDSRKNIILTGHDVAKMYGSSFMAATLNTSGNVYMSSKLNRLYENNVNSQIIKEGFLNCPNESNPFIIFKESSLLAQFHDCYYDKQIGLATIVVPECAQVTYSPQHDTFSSNQIIVNKIMSPFEIPMIRDSFVEFTKLYPYIHESHKFFTDEQLYESFKYSCTFRYIPNERKDKKMCLFAVEVDGLNLEYVPKNLKNYEICLLAVRGRSGALKYVPNEFKTDELCSLALEKNTEKLYHHHAINFVPKELLNKDKLIKAINQNLDVI